MRFSCGEIIYLLFTSIGIISCIYFIFIKITENNSNDNDNDDHNLYNINNKNNLQDIVYQILYKNNLIN
jgi:hypothetical protein